MAEGQTEGVIGPHDRGGAETAPYLTMRPKNLIINKNNS